MSSVEEYRRKRQKEVTCSCGEKFTIRKLTGMAMLMSKEANPSISFDTSIDKPMTKEEIVKRLKEMTPEQRKEYTKRSSESVNWMLVVGTVQPALSLTETSDKLGITELDDCCRSTLLKEITTFSGWSKEAIEAREDLAKSPYIQLLGGACRSFGRRPSESIDVEGLLTDLEHAHLDFCITQELQMIASDQGSLEAELTQKEMQMLWEMKS